MRLHPPFSWRLAAGAALATLGAAAAGPARLSDADRRALDAISADSLRGHLSFLASDALGGRVDGTTGLDVAAEYVAAQMRRAGLDPLGDDGYFQSAPALVAVPQADGFRFSLALPEETIEVPVETFEMTTVEPVALDAVEVVKAPPGRTDLLDAVAGRVVLTERNQERVPRREAGGSGGKRRWLGEVLEARPALVVVVDRTLGVPTGYFDTRAILEPRSSYPARPRIVATSAAGLARAYDAMAAGPSRGRLSLHVAEPRRQAMTLRNVAGLLRGSDPEPGATSVLVSAHYDGTGPEPGTSGPDRIWNGANDDASGTAGVVELAAALSRLSPRPRRSIAFLAFFGEEQGLLGSAYYAAHPLVPLERTVAMLNLEHLGRTDSAQGSRAGTVSLTGDGYSDLSAVVEEAGQATGVEVAKDPRRSEAFFEFSDNYPLAAAGVVAHTMAVVYVDWPDYHGPHDEWTKIDFANLERTVRTAGAAVLLLAESDAEPHWRPDVPAAAPFRAAWDARHTAPAGSR